MSVLIRVLAILAAFILELYCCFRAYQSGDRNGFARGKLHADNWWIGVDKEVEYARQKIREENKA